MNLINAMTVCVLRVCPLFTFLPLFSFDNSSTVAAKASIYLQGIFHQTQKNKK